MKEKWALNHNSPKKVFEKTATHSVRLASGSNFFTYGPLCLIFDYLMKQQMGKKGVLNHVWTIVPFVCKILNNNNVHKFVERLATAATSSSDHFTP